MERHTPHALLHKDEIGKHIHSRDVVYVFLDYDGTLTPIVSNPPDAVMTPESRQAVLTLSKARRAVVSIVTGRKLSTVREFVQLEEIAYAGSHGFDIVLEGGQSVQFGQEYLCDLKGMYDSLQDMMSTYPGMLIEDNLFALSVHYRNMKSDSVDDALAEVSRRLASYEGRLRSTNGKKVLEIRPNIVWHKGKAVEFLVAKLLAARGEQREKVSVIYIGDDTTDEDAFQCLSSSDLGILVSSTARETSATMSLDNPEEVVEFLRWLTEALA